MSNRKKVVMITMAMMVAVVSVGTVTATANNSTRYSYNYNFDNIGSYGYSAYQYKTDNSCAYVIGQNGVYSVGFYAHLFLNVPTVDTTQGTAPYVTRTNGRKYIYNNLYERYRAANACLGGQKITGGQARGQWSPDSSKY